MPVRVLIVDDSESVRSIIRTMVMRDPGCEVVAEAANGLEAIAAVRVHKPDIVTMDLNMPLMNGFDAIEAIMSEHPVPILVITGRDDRDSAYSALGKGALDVMSKADIQPSTASQFTSQLKLLARVKVVTHIKHIPPSGPVPPASGGGWVVVIASSTGGPKALADLFSALPAELPFPILIAQHIASGFASGMVDWLDGVAGLVVKLARDGEPLRLSTVYISEPDRDLTVADGLVARYTDPAPGAIYRPSCDALLSSAARVCGSRCMGIIMTGMGRDGVLGLKRIRESEGITIAQDEASSVIYGMNRVAVESGSVDRIRSIQGIAEEITSLAGRLA
jgi:two-component system chemotaxis response regulator CheB